MNALPKTIWGPGRGLGWSLVRLAAVAAVVVLAVLEIPGLGVVRTRLAGADAGWVVFASALEFGSVLAFAFAWHGAFARRLAPRLSCALGMTAQGVNVLAPAGGTSGIAVAGVLARRTDLGDGFIAERSVGLFVLTTVATNVLLIMVGGFGAASGVLPGRVSLWGSLAPALGALALLAAVATLGRVVATGPARAETRWGRGRWAMALRWALVHLRQGFAWGTQTARLRDPVLVAGSLGYVLFDLAALVAAFHAIGGAAPPAGTLLLAYALGQAGALVALPGAAAGGMVGIFALYHFPALDATAAVLLYQVVSSLVPLALGVLGALAAARLSQPASAAGHARGTHGAAVQR